MRFQTILCDVVTVKTEYGKNHIEILTKNDHPFIHSLRLPLKQLQ